MKYLKKTILIASKKGILSPPNQQPEGLVTPSKIDMEPENTQFCRSKIHLPSTSMTLGFKILPSLKPITIAPENQWLGDYFPQVLVNFGWWLSHPFKK